MGWIAEVYCLLPKYIGKDIDNSEEEIEHITCILNVLVRNNLLEAYEAILLNASDRLIINYVNVQEKPQVLFYHLRELGLDTLCNYLWNYVYTDYVLDFDM